MTTNNPTPPTSAASVEAREWHLQNATVYTLKPYDGPGRPASGFEKVNDNWFTVYGPNAEAVAAEVHAALSTPAKKPAGREALKGLVPISKDGRWAFIDGVGDVELDYDRKLALATPSSERLHCGCPAGGKHLPSCPTIMGDIARLEAELGVEGPANVFREALRRAKEARPAPALSTPAEKPAGPEALPTGDDVDRALRTYEQYGGALRYLEKDKWHLCDRMAMREVLKQDRALAAPGSATGGEAGQAEASVYDRTDLPAVKFAAAPTSEWKLVPVEPTAEMIEAGQWPAEDDGALACWRAMLAAAPSSPNAVTES